MILVLLLTCFVSATIAAERGQTQLADAVMNRDAALARALVKRGHVDAKQPDGATALHWAAHWSDREIAALLIDAGADVNAVNDYGVTPLSLAATNANAPMISLLLAHGANANAALPSGETVLMTAAYTGNAAIVEALIRAGAAVNATEHTMGQAALMWALSQKHMSVVKVLIEHGADVHQRSESGFTPLLFAAREGDIDAARLLLARGVPVNEMANDKSTALHIAVIRGQVPFAKFLLDEGADPNADGPGFTPLHWAAGIWETMFTHDYHDSPTANLGEWNVLGGLPRSTKAPMIEALLAKGADVNARLERSPPRFGYNLERAAFIIGATPFFLATLAGDTATMKLLLAHGADSKIGSVGGITPLMMAAGRGRVDDEAKTPESQQLEAVKLMLDLGADINASDSNGDTPLHCAVYAGLDSIVEYLIGHGAALNPTNKAGVTPLKAATDGFVSAGMLATRSSTAALLRRLGASMQ
jgi:ankyrin repeat protein